MGEFVQCAICARVGEIRSGDDDPPPFTPDEHEDRGMKTGGSVNDLRFKQ
jgi:hypothetical protein